MTKLLPLVATVACGPGTAVLLGPEPEVSPSPHVEAAFRVAWTGSAGQASLWAVDVRDASAAQQHGIPDEVGEPWRLVSQASVDAGTAQLPLALWPAGSTVALRVRVETDEGLVTWSPYATVDIPDAPESLGGHDLKRHGDSQLAGGWIVSHRYAKPGQPDDGVALVLDDEGEIVWWYPSPEPGWRVVRVKPTLDGTAVLVLLDHLDEVDRIERVSLAGTEVISTAFLDAHHDFVEVDGTLTALTYLRSEGPMIRGDAHPVATDQLSTQRLGETDPNAAVVGFDFFDDYPVEPWKPCNHANADEFVPGYVDWTHSNSLLRDPANDGWLIVARFLDAVLRVGDPGALEWQAGGRDADLTPASASAEFRHPHASDAWDDRILLFDNGDHGPEPIVSRVVELRLDPESGTYTQVWELADPAGRYAQYLGDARRLPGGNTLVDWTPFNELAEYTPEGEEVWRRDADEPLGRVIWTDALRP